MLTKEEVKKVIDHMNGLPRLMAILLYGAGFRLMECCHLRIKDIDFSRNEIVVRAGKGDKDRHTMLPTAIQGISIADIFEAVRCQHQKDIEKDLVVLHCRMLWSGNIRTRVENGAWQWVFPATSHFTDRVTGEKRRHHLHESVLQRAFKDARL